MNPHPVQRVGLMINLARLLMLLKQKYARHRRVGVRPLFRKRLEQGDGDNLINELRFDKELFFNYTRLTCERFDYLLSLVGPELTKKKKMKTVILPNQRLAMTLRYLAVGDSQATLSFSYRCGRATVSKIIRETLAAIVKVLHKKVIDLPTSHEQWKSIASEFWFKWNLPHCLGAIDGKHVQIQAPKCSGSVYFNYKKTFSINLMAVADADYSFIAVDVGGEGSLHDNAVFRQSVFGKRLENNELNLPESDVLPGTREKIDYFFVGDGAFQLRNNLMKPYAVRKLSMKEAIYNYRVSRGRRVVENAFGILAARWRIFRQPLCCNVDTADLIVLASVCLHNFILRSRDMGIRKQYCPDRFVDAELDDGTVVDGAWRMHVDGDQTALLPVPPSRSRNCTKSATAVRELLTDYFSGAGTVPWQEEKIKKGFWGSYVSTVAESDSENEEVSQMDVSG